MAKIIEIKGNIFNSTCQTIVNTVNCQGFMGKGIALEFKNRYPDMFLIYKAHCDDGKYMPGKLFLWTKSNPWILNFPTKDNWRFPSRIDYIVSGLKKFAQTYKEKCITSIAFPQLGTSNGGLDWKIVKEVMFKYLSPLDNLEIEIYEFDPKATDELFTQMIQIFGRFQPNDFKNKVSLKTPQANKLFNAFQSNNLHSIYDIQNIPGIGEITLEQLYKFVNSSKGKRILTSSEENPGFVF